MRGPITKRVSIAGLALALSACVLNGGGRPDWVDEFEEEFGTEHARELTLEVRNDYSHNATLYAHGSGYRERIGIVSRNSSQTFRFRWSVSDLSIEVDLLSSGSIFTPHMPVKHGETLELVIASDARQRAKR